MKERNPSLNQINRVAATPEINNIMISIIICVLSMCSHMLSFIELSFQLYGHTGGFLLVKVLSGLLNTFRLSTTIFVYLFLNKIFRDNFTAIFFGSFGFTPVSSLK